MAEFGAHLTSTRKEGDDDLPSVFDVLAQESLLSSLRPAVHHILNVLTFKYPGKLGFVAAFQDELYTALHFLLEQHYVGQYGGSFSENFYGFKRIPTSSHEKNGAGTGLSKKCYIRSVVLVVFVPYIKSKCDNWYELLLEQKASGLLNGDSWKKKLCRAFLAVYPIIHMSWEGCLFTYQLLYALGKSAVHSPLLYLAGVKLQYLQPGDEQTANELDTSDHKGISSKMRKIFVKCLHMLVTALSGGLSVSIFFLQFLDWWYSTDKQAVSLIALPTPPLPQVPRPDSVPVLHTMCPLCHRVRKNDTVLSVTGYVFCYPCIYRHIRENACCPVTGYPARTDHLVKLYLPDG